jgi:hypothetical protein
MKVVLAVLSFGTLLTIGAARAGAQDAPPPAKSDEVPSALGRSDDDADGAPVLGEPFESLGLGIALRGPAGSRVIRQVGGTEVDFVQEKNKWNLRVARLTLTQPMPLQTTKDAEGLKRVGLLEVTLDRLKDDLPGATILRSDVVRVGETDVGMLALRYVKGLETLLCQQAIVRGSDRQYFTLTLTSPGSKAAGKEPGDDPAEAKAVAVFGEILDTIRLLDQRPVLRDQEERLVYGTRGLLVNLGGKGVLQSKLIPQQWFRLLRNGKDVGYVYTVEEAADGIPGNANALRARKPGRRGTGGPEGILIGTRTRSLAGPEARLDVESWMYCATDRRVEEWSTLQVVQNLKDASQFDHATTVGSSSRRTGRRLDRAAVEHGKRWDKEDPNQPPVVQTDDYVLNVTHSSKTENTEPLSQSVSDWYLPQALSHLLPRLLPLDEPKKYLFAVYVPDVRKVMHRYVDVGAEKKVNFGGRQIRAIPVSDRIGLEGSVTTHYMGLDGTYLGSENPDSGIVVLPSDEKTLLEMWKDADLTRPADVKPREARPAAAQKPITQGKK